MDLTGYGQDLLMVSYEKGKRTSVFHKKRGIIVCYCYHYCYYYYCCCYNYYRYQCH